MCHRRMDMKTVYPTTNKVCGGRGYNHEILIILIWAMSQENLSSGFATRKDSNRPAQPQKLATGLKFWI